MKDNVSRVAEFIRKSLQQSLEHFIWETNTEQTQRAIKDVILDQLHRLERYRPIPFVDINFEKQVELGIMSKKDQQKILNEDLSKVHVTFLCPVNFTPYTFKGE